MEIRDGEGGVDAMRDVLCSLGQYKNNKYQHPLTIIPDSINHSPRYIDIVYSGLF